MSAVSISGEAVRCGAGHTIFEICASCSVTIYCVLCDHVCTCLTNYKALGEAGYTERAAKCLDDMEEDGLSPNVISYSAAISACRDAPEKVLELLARMRGEGGRVRVDPNIVALTSAMGALGRAGGKYTGESQRMV